MSRKMELFDQLCSFCCFVLCYICLRQVMSAPYSVRHRSKDSTIGMRGTGQILAQVSLSLQKWTENHGFQLDSVMVEVL